jgi:hypothetical protein
MCKECQNFGIKPQEKHNVKKINEQCNVVLKARSKRNVNICQKRSHPDKTLTYSDACCKNNFREKKRRASGHSTTSFRHESHMRLNT